MSGHPGDDAAELLSSALALSRTPIQFGNGQFEAVSAMFIQLYGDAVLELIGVCQSTCANFNRGRLAEIESCLDMLADRERGGWE